MVLLPSSRESPPLALVLQQISATTDEPLRVVHVIGDAVSLSWNQTDDAGRRFVQSMAVTDDDVSVLPAGGRAPLQ